MPGLIRLGLARVHRWAALPLPAAHRGTDSAASWGAYAGTEAGNSPNLVVRCPANMGLSCFTCSLHRWKWGWTWYQRAREESVDQVCLCLASFILPTLVWLCTGGKWRGDVRTCFFKPRIEFQKPPHHPQFALRSGLSRSGLLPNIPGKQGSSVTINILGQRRHLCWVLAAKLWFLLLSWVQGGRGTREVF